jgi:hypothetical protein
MGVTGPIATLDVNARPAAAGRDYAIKWSPCEHAFVGEHRSAHAVFQHAVQQRNLLSAEAAARELGRLSLADALAFLLLLSEKDPARFDPAAARWHARFVLEARGLRLSDSQLLLGAVAGLRAPAPVIPLDTIHALAEKAHLTAVATAARRRL